MTKQGKKPQNSDETYEFCSQCGKILIYSNRTLRCPKCGKVESKTKTTQLEIEKKISKKLTKEEQYTPQIKKNIEVKQKQNTKIRNFPPQNASIEDWQKYFPYLNIRPQQAQIIKAVTEGGNSKKHILIQAANGVGKTISILSSMIPISISQNKTIVYCCRTHEQMSRVISELRMIKQLSPVSGVAMRGRRDLCLHPLIQRFAVDARNAADICNHLKKDGKCKFFSNLGNKNLMKQVNSSISDNILDSQDFIEIGEAHNICPFELSKKMLSKANVIAASYQYIFNPNIRTTFLNSIERDLSDIILVVDEAHNLPATAIDISSNSITSFTIENALAEAGRHKQGYLYDILEAFSEILRKECSALKINQEVPYKPEELLKSVEQRGRIQIKEEVVLALENLGNLVKNEKMKRNRTPLSSASNFARFLSVLLGTRKSKSYAHFLTQTESQRGGKTPKMTTLSLDPRTITEEIFRKVSTSVSASGTLDPMDAYISLIGLELKKIMKIALESPYSEENVLPLVVQKVSTKLQYRTPENFQMMVKIIDAVVKATPKNVGIFCTSYRILENLLDNGLERYMIKPLYIAHKGMKSIENDELVERFKNESRKEGGILLSVLGGRSSEGSDYPAEEMQSVIVVGIPFARPGPTIEASIEYLENQFPNKGRDYGYNIPALIRASQAAGRPIRSLEDYAAIIMLDYRFGISYYRQHLPNWIIKNLRIVQPNEEEIEKRVKQFFEYHSS